MSTEPTVRRNFHVATVDKGGRQIRSGIAPLSPTVGRLPRLARIMALAIHFERLLARGAISSQADLARAGQVSCARATQILDLTNLAPDIQEQLLHLPVYKTGRAPMTERQIRHISLEPNWEEQRKLFERLNCNSSAKLRV